MPEHPSTEPQRPAQPSISLPIQTKDYLDLTHNGFVKAALRDPILIPFMIGIAMASIFPARLAVPAIIQASKRISAIAPLALDLESAIDPVFAYMLLRGICALTPPFLAYLVCGPEKSELTGKKLTFKPRDAYIVRPGPCVSFYPPIKHNGVLHTMQMKPTQSIHWYRNWSWYDDLLSARQIEQTSAIKKTVDRVMIYPDAPAKPYPVPSGYTIATAEGEKKEGFTEVKFMTKKYPNETEGNSYVEEHAYVPNNMLTKEELHGRFYPGRTWYSPVIGLLFWKFWQVNPYKKIPTGVEEVPPRMTPLVNGYYLELSVTTEVKRDKKSRWSI